MSKNEQNFDQLKKLLKLKQHEVPPPGYFSNFSGQVVSRIRAGEVAHAQSFADRMEGSSSWFSNFLRIFDTKPGLVGGFAASLCLLLLLTVVFAERAEPAPKNIFATAETGGSMTQPAASTTAGGAPMLATANFTGGIVASTNPVTSLQPMVTFFGSPASAGLFQPPSTPASFVPPGQ